MGGHASSCCANWSRKLAERKDASDGVTEPWSSKINHLLASRYVRKLTTWCLGPFYVMFYCL
jgi:hypothetical protein